MPTKKPVIQTVVDENTYGKFKEICQREDRTDSKMAAIMIQKYIEQYEKEHGRINSAELSVSKTG